MPEVHFLVSAGNLATAEQVKRTVIHLEKQVSHTSSPVPILGRIYTVFYVSGQSSAAGMCSLDYGL